MNNREKKIPPRNHWNFRVLKTHTYTMALFFLFFTQDKKKKKNEKPGGEFQEKKNLLPQIFLYFLYFFFHSIVANWHRPLFSFFFFFFLSFDDIVWALYVGGDSVGTNNTRQRKDNHDRRVRQWALVCLQKCAPAREKEKWIKMKKETRFYFYFSKCINWLGLGDKRRWWQEFI